MALKQRFLSTLFFISTLTFLFSCGQDNSVDYKIQTDKTITNNSALTIDTFSTFPPEIDGCSCYFSNDSTEFSQGKFIYLNDFATTSFLKINGILTKFTQTDFNETNSTKVTAKYKSVNYEMTIEVINGNQNGDETILKSGTIKLSDKKGNTITKTFYGECGC